MTTEQFDKIGQSASEINEALSSWADRITLSFLSSLINIILLVMESSSSLGREDSYHLRVYARSLSALVTSDRDSGRRE